MIAISRWANRNRTLARFSLIGSKLALYLLSILLGYMLLWEQVFIPKSLPVIALLVLIVGVLGYPKFSNKQQWIRSFYKRKLCDGLLALATALCLILAPNHLPKMEFINKAEAVTLNPKLETFEGGTKANRGFSKIRAGFHKVSTAFKSYTNRVMSKFLSNDKGNKTAFIILTILGMIVLTAGIVVLSCSLACSGMDVLATIILLGGITGIVVGSIYIFKAINKKYGTSR